MTKDEFIAALEYSSEEINDSFEIQEHVDGITLDLADGKLSLEEAISAFVGIMADYDLLKDFIAGLFSGDADKILKSTNMLSALIKANLPQLINAVAGKDE